MQLETDTIVAVATPPGRGGIGVVRLSGPAALSIALGLVRLRRLPVCRQVHAGVAVDAEGRRLDVALLTWFEAPASYTGEDVVEISTHGSPVVLQAVLQAAVGRGARLARAGEFTERAYLAGKLDLTAAEAVRDLIDAQTLDQARLAAEQLGGSLAREVAPIKEALLAVVAALEAGIDFAEDDLPPLSGGEIQDRLRQLLPPLGRLERSFARGRLMREGLKLAIVGKPNAGKSSLFNRLLGRDRAIVTEIAGTTRDVVSESFVLEGVPVQLLDTAGLRETADPVERIGVERAREAIAEADLILHLVDATEGIDDVPGLGAMRGASASPVLVVWNKADLLSAEGRARLHQFGPACARPLDSPGNITSRQDVTGDLTLRQDFTASVTLPRETTPLAGGNWTIAAAAATETPLLVSALTGEGMQELQAQLIRRCSGPSQAPNTALLTNARQHAAVLAAYNALQQAEEAAGRSTAHEFLLLLLYEALEALDSLTGQTTPDDVLERIFTTFCIGK